MTFEQHTHPDNLERYSFLWSEARLAIAAVALFIGGYPVLLFIFPTSLYGVLVPVLKLSWIASGAASGYLLYRWNAGGRKLFGAKEQRDAVAFWISVVSGLNLGVTGLLGTNIGMSIASSRPIFFAVGALYLFAAHHLWRRFAASGKKIF